MAAALYDATVVEHHDDVALADGGKAVRDDKNRSAVHEPVGTLLHYLFGARIYRRSSLVEYHDGRVGDCGTGYRKQLALSLA